MPKRKDIKKILIIGAGPIVIGQACEFDYSGAQACKSLKEEGYQVILINSNPATIMTDPEIANSTYIEPITREFVEKIIKLEKPDALLPTMGGQTALNVSMELFEKKILEKYGVTMIGANPKAIELAEDRQKFKDAMREIGLSCPKSLIVKNSADAEKVKTTQSDINNFVGKFLNKDSQMENASGYHKGLFTAMNSDAIANHFYEQGKADALKDSMAKSKNINMDPRQAHSAPTQSGVKVRVLGEDNSPRAQFKIKSRK